jgi:hypothetical protein
MAQDDDPRAPYKVYGGDELKGTYATRAEARRRQLEGQQNVISSLGITSTASSFDWAGSLRPVSPQS